MKKASASLKATVSVVPTLSHSVLVALLIVAAISLIAGLSFLWHEKSGTWVPFSIFFFLITLTGIGWWKSQKVIDMGNASPTTVLDQSGNQVITDSRMLESAHAIENLGTLFQSIGVRQPLPEPDGVIGDDGEVLKNSQIDAANIANEINQGIKTHTDDFMQEIIRGGLEVAQSTPQLPEESFKEVLEHNKPDLEK